MKKSIFAVAVASALTLGAAQAETVLYGSVRFDYENKKDEQGWDNGSSLRTNLKERVSNFNDLGSRIGLKGSEDLGNGNAVIYHLEWGFNGMGSNATKEKDNSFSTRLAYMGFTGDWGTVAMGRQNNPFKQTIVDDSIIDDFNGVGSAATQRAMTSTLMTQSGLASVTDVTVDNKVVGTAPSVKHTSTALTRVGKALAYVSPDFNGFGFNAAVIMDEDLKPNKHVDLWTVNASYNYDMGANGNLYAKAGYIQGKTTDDNNAKVWGVNLGYKQDAFGLTAAYADGRHTDEQTNVKEKSKGWDVGTSFSFGPNYYSTVRLAYGENHVKVEGDKDKVKSWAVGFEQKLSQRTRAWVEYGQEESKFANQDLDKLKDNKVSIGMRHDF